MKLSHILLIAALVASTAFLFAGTPASGDTVSTVRIVERERTGDYSTWYYDVYNNDPTRTLIAFAVSNDFGYKPFADRSNWSSSQYNATQWNAGQLYGWAGNYYNTTGLGSFGDLFPGYSRVFFFHATSLGDSLAPNQSSIGEFGYYGGVASIGLGAFNGGGSTGPFDTQAVPEPATIGLFGMGLIGLLALRRRKKA